ncbi:SDR family NAD(P)-dependent oxidoreductase [Rhizobium leguminosarum]|uniref:SDR family NAD(P)-dependent oxidoreductase n=1 Tax=Rhizobium leguminosarum TaxID=384 RepID=UPI001C963DCC|nr:SDR family NAD(P)-dependent oxidoreductase [Rhizobium leguminosarum]MBY5410801.1 SDR family NAD(P)-dependent oxidoreductase [Rhizobium leguminosarum]
MLIRGASFIVTGGGSGLGAAIVRALVEAGGRVTIADLNAEAGQEIAREFGSDACFVKADVTDGEEGAAVVAAAVEAFGSLRGLVNCAGVAPAEKVIGRDGPHRLESFARTVGINLIGTFNMIRLAAAAIQTTEPDAEGERGVIVNTASVAAFDMPAEVQAALGKSVPFPPRLGRPAEFAGLVRHIFENNMLNGEVIRLDGALRMGAR